MSSYPYNRTLELERRDPDAFKVFRLLYRELSQHQRQVREPGALEKKCRTTLRRFRGRELPWLTTDQINWLASSFAMYRPPSAQARVSLYETFQDHWRETHPLTPNELEKALSSNERQAWPRRVNPSRDMGYSCDLDGPLPLRDESDLACWIRDKLKLLPPEDSPEKSRPGGDIKLGWLNDDIRDAVFWLRHFGHAVELPKRCQDFDSADREFDRLLRLAAPQTPKVDATGAAENSLATRLEALERRSEETPKRLTQREKIREQRNNFSCKRRTKHSPETWNKIYHAYNKKFPDDKDASPATLRLSHDRNCQKCRTA